MAKSILELVKSNFKTENSSEAIKETIDLILQNHDFFSKIGQKGPLTWASEAKRNLEEIDSLGEKGGELYQRALSDSDRDKFEELEDKWGSYVRQAAKYKGKDEAKYNKYV